MDKDGKTSYTPINSQDGVSFNYGTNDFKVKVEAGPNYAIQKSKTLQLIMGLAQAMPMFAQFINSSDGLPIIIKLLDLPGAEELLDQVRTFVMQQKQMQMQQAQAQAQQPNPAMLKLQQEAMKIQLDAKQNEAKNKLQAADILLKDKALDTERMKIDLEAHVANAEAAVALDKHNAEKVRAYTDLAMQAANLSHGHKLDHHRLINETTELKHKIAETARQHAVHEASESKSQESREHS